MKTKLVYVLTCAPEATYIEQALMAIFSARHWNPDAWIVLLTDDKTSALMHDRGSHRGELLQYISEEIVSTFDADKNMMYRSRWIKTMVRELVSGDFLFIDCDTICCRSLADVDSFDCKVGAVLESHLTIAELNPQMQSEIEEKASLVGWSLKNETKYFSSGVIYAKDVEEVHSLYGCWHETWATGVKCGINIDQPTLAKANIDCGHIIQMIPDSYNCILFTEPQNTPNAHILHVAAFRNPSFLFEAKTLNFIKENGLNDWLKKQVLNPCNSFRPFDYEIFQSNIFQRIKWIFRMAKVEKEFVREIGCECHGSSCPDIFKSLFWVTRKRINVIRHKDRIKDNVCRK